ncbi:MAG: site-2 protease family protein, partial [Candidatus Binatia bacterium]
MNGESEQHASPFPRRRTSRPWLHVLLFALTSITTTIAGALQNGVNPLTDPWAVTSGLPFSVTLMTILLVHEMGHYTMSRYHGVRASLPFFLPAPPFPFIIGTFGAFIRMESPPRDRRSLFDVGAAGPLAGLALAIPAVVIGLALSTISPEKTSDGGIVLGSSLLLSFLSDITLGLQPDEVNIVLHPIGFAGWVGLLVTMMNLLPVGQLDGGHVVYALFGERHIWISRLAVVIILSLGLSRLWDGWLIWGALLLFIGARHPAPLDPYTPLDLKRQLAAWLTLAVLVLTFIPVPFSIQESDVSDERVLPREPSPRHGSGMNGGPL